MARVVHMDKRVLRETLDKMALQGPKDNVEWTVRLDRMECQDYRVRLAIKDILAYLVLWVPQALLGRL